MLVTRKQMALWVLRAQSGDREAFELLLCEIQPSLRRYLSVVVGSFDADDVLQEVLLQIYRKLTWLQTPELFRPWAFRTASRAGFRHASRRQRQSAAVVHDVPLDRFPIVDVPVDQRQLHELLKAHRISAGASAVLTLHFQEDLSLVEVAAILELSLGTVKSRLAYGLAALRRRMREKRGE